MKSYGEARKGHLRDLAQLARQAKQAGDMETFRLAREMWRTRATATERKKAPGYLEITF